MARVAGRMGAWALGAILCAACGASGPRVTRVEWPRGALSLEADTGQVCALRDGRVQCWGGGYAHAVSRQQYAGRDRALYRVSMRIDAVTLAAGDAHTCALVADGAVWCWGLNARGKLGTGFCGGASEAPVRAQLPLPAHALSAVESTTCALLDDTSVACWGGDPRRGLAMTCEAERVQDATGGALTGVVALEGEGGRRADGTWVSWAPGPLAPAERLARVPYVARPARGGARSPNAARVEGPGVACWADEDWRRVTCTERELDDTVVELDSTERPLARSR
ncbi:MAG: RCC1 domain-containing protein [Sandaracinaceae bacterium]